MSKIYFLVALSSIVYASGAHLAFADCDFLKPTGACSATITIDSAGGSHPSFSAEITIRSSARSCSKVEYFLDQTPHSTILKKSSSEEESLFSTNRIGKKNIKVAKCTTFASTSSQDSKNTPSRPAGPEFFRGHWKGSAGILLFRGPVEVTIDSVAGGVANGMTYFPGDGTTKVINGRIQGNSLTYTYTDLEHMVITLTQKGPNTLSYVGVGEGGTVSGSLTRQ